MAKDCGNVVGLHPALGLPAHEFNFFCGKVLGADHGSSAVVFLEPLILAQSLIAEVFGHGRSRIRRWALDVGPLTVASGRLGRTFAAVPAARCVTAYYASPPMHTA